MSYLALSAITVCNFLQSFSPPSLSLSARCSVAFCCQNCQPGSRFYLPRARFSLYLALPLWLFHEKQPFAQIHKWWRWRVGGGKRRQKFPLRILNSLSITFNLFIKNILFFSSSSPPFILGSLRRAASPSPYYGSIRTNLQGISDTRLTGVS